MRSIDEKGFAMVTVLLLLALLMSLLMAYSAVTAIEQRTLASSMDSLRGFYTAEAGLNLRAETVRQTFVGFATPTGTSPDSSGAKVPCLGTNQGSGDLKCVPYVLEDRTVQTYVESPGGSVWDVIPRGELFQDLTSEEFRWVVAADARSPQGNSEALLELHFKSRLVPLFQFAAFFDKDLEILPSGAMRFDGPVHANGDLYVGTDATLDVTGQVTTAGRLYRGRKEADTCMAGAVNVADPDTQVEIPTCSGTRAKLDPAALGAWNNMIHTGISAVSTLGPTLLEPVAGEPYWDRADVRIALDLNPGVPVIEVRNADGSVAGGATMALAACGALGNSGTFYNHREVTTVEMLDIDVEALLDCLHIGSILAAGSGIDDTTDGGMIWHLSVDGPLSGSTNPYGVRLRNGARLASTQVGAPLVVGLTVVTDQAIYIEGDFNAVDKIPAAVMADTLNILSNNWSDANSAGDLTVRIGADTTINAAFLAGSDTTGGADGSAGQDVGDYGGGLENLPRLHEDWNATTLTLRGSFVSLDAPHHAAGKWIYGAPYYTAPVRDWNLDEDFRDPALLPPLTPRFVFLRQELFVRRFEL